MEFVVTAAFVLPIVWLVAVVVVKGLELRLHRKLISPGSIALTIFVGSVVAGVVAVIALSVYLSIVYGHHPN